MPHQVSPGGSTLIYDKGEKDIQRGEEEIHMNLNRAVILVHLDLQALHLLPHHHNLDQDSDLGINMKI